MLKSASFAVSLKRFRFNSRKIRLLQQSTSKGATSTTSWTISLTTLHWTGTNNLELINQVKLMIYSITRFLNSEIKSVPKVSSLESICSIFQRIFYIWQSCHKSSSLRWITVACHSVGLSQIGEVKDDRDLGILLAGLKTN